MPIFKWRGILASENEMTGDGRFIESGALDLSQTPSPLMFVREASQGHDGAVTVGNITSMSRDGDNIVGEGTFRDTDESPEATEAISLIVGQYARGVSLDLDSLSFSVRVAEELLEFNEEREVDDEGRVVLFEVNNEDEVMSVSEGRVRGATLVSVPAFANAYIEVLDDSGEAFTAETFTEFAVATSDEDIDLPAPSFNLSAAGTPPSDIDPDLFSNPNLGQLTPLTVDGNRVYGHLAGWDTCHIGFDQCVTAPRQNGDYSSFHQSSIMTNAGPLSVGRLTHGGGHASPNLEARPAIEHYDDVGTTAAFVRVGEDEHGIWFAGVLADDLTLPQQRAFAASPLSGDWRRIGSSLRLVAACSVNTPGFPIARVASGQQQTLIASAGRPVDEHLVAAGPTADEIARRVLELMAENEEKDALKGMVAIMSQDIEPNIALAVEHLSASVHVDSQ